MDFDGVNTPAIEGTGFQARVGNGALKARDDDCGQHSNVSHDDHDFDEGESDDAVGFHDDSGSCDVVVVRCHPGQPTWF